MWGYSPPALGSSTPRDEDIFGAGLPVEVAHGGWWRATLATLTSLLVCPNRSFRAVEEPVAHGPALAFIVSLRLPTWGVLMALYLISWVEAPPDTLAPIRSSVASEALGLQLADVCATWMLLMVPLRIPIIYFAAGLAGHMVMTLTGGAHRSIGASMRALGFAFAPLALVVGALELGLVVFGLSPEMWTIVFASTTSIAWVAASIALARTHEATVVRGLFVSLVPLLVFCGDAVGAASFELESLPFASPVDTDYKLPLPPL